ncbi:MAG: AAA family ATPase [Gemmatimonadota bacterium]
MNDDFRRVVHDKLKADGQLQTDWSKLVLAACDGTDALDAVLNDEIASDTIEPDVPHVPTSAYLTSLTVQGFRGIGPTQTLAFTPGPGLTIVIGRNGSGKSSFAEALEVLFTGDSKRWSERSKIWKEGWRSLHQPDAARIETELLLERAGSAKLACSWDGDAAFEAKKVVVQPKGKSKTSLQALGWDDALLTYRPFLSYNELGSMLDEGPAKLYDAISLVLGLEKLVEAQKALAQSRLDRKKALDAADQQRKLLVQALNALLQGEPDERVSQCLAALTSRDWGLDTIEEVLAIGAGDSDPHIAILKGAAALAAPDADRVTAAVDALRDADAQLKAIAGTDAETSRQLAQLLEAAIAFHAAHGDRDCPVCGNESALSDSWAAASRKEVARLRAIATESEQAHRAAAAARRSARERIAPVPNVLEKLVEIGIDGAATARDHWWSWQSGSAIAELLALATHLEAHHATLAHAVEAVRKAAADELRRREDRWRPIADGLAAWLPGAQEALIGAEQLLGIKAAEAWLKDASATIRNERFAPIADKAMATWEHLRQQSNVTLGRIELVGAGTQRRVTLDVTVDGIAGAALSVMSQGELHSLALSLFLPRATSTESPFRFVVIDDPVQSMDPARVDGLARALDETARTRQVIVFTHDERLPEAVRRLGIKSTILSLTRRPKSVVEVKTALDPVRAYVQDARALVLTSDLPNDVLRSLVPGFCRSALEAACMTVIRRRRLAAGSLMARSSKSWRMLKN